MTKERDFHTRDGDKITGDLPKLNKIHTTVIDREIQILVCWVAAETRKIKSPPPRNERTSTDVALKNLERRRPDLRSRNAVPHSQMGVKWIREDPDETSFTQ